MTTRGGLTVGCQAHNLEVLVQLQAPQHCFFVNQGYNSNNIEPPWFMAKFEEKIKARELRRKGKSIRDIVREVDASKGSVSNWCKDIKLTSQQIDTLDKKMREGRYRGCLKGAQIQKEKRKREKISLRKKGAELAKSFTKKELLYFGAGLYLGDGSKQRRVKFTNSDDRVVNIIIEWLRRYWGVGKDRLKLQIYVNKDHSDRVEEIEKHWSKSTTIPKANFNKTVLYNSKNKKVYENPDDYYGTASLTVSRSGDLRQKIKGLVSEIID